MTGFRNIQILQSAKNQLRQGLAKSVGQRLITQPYLFLYWDCFSSLISASIFLFPLLTLNLQPSSWLHNYIKNDYYLKLRLEVTL